MQLNFQGALAGLGHGLATLGTQGIEEQQRVRADARLTARETALANLHHDWQEEDTANAPADYKALSGVTVDRAVQEANAVTIPVRRATVAAEMQMQDHHLAVEHGYRTEEQGTAHGYRMAELTAEQQGQFNRWRLQHGIEENDSRARLQWEADNNLGPGGQPRVLRDATSGNYVTLDRHGVQVNTGIRYPRPTSFDLGLGGDDTGDGTDASGAGSGGGSSSAPAPPRRPRLTPRPAAPSNDTPPVPGARRAPDGNWYVTRGGRNFLVQGN